MTGIERLRSAIRGEKADRVPVFCNLLDQGARELGMGLRDYYSKGEHIAEAQLAMRAKYGYDNLWSLFYVGKEAELLGCRKIVFSDAGPPNVGQLIIRSPGDIHDLKIPDRIEDEPAF
jgi:uroporphyrinogen-III decarboxylase